MAYTRDDYIEDHKQYGLKYYALLKPHLYWVVFVDLLIGGLMLLWEIQRMYEERNWKMNTEITFFDTGITWRCFHRFLIILGILLLSGALGLLYGIYYDNEKIIHFYQIINFPLFLILGTIAIIPPFFLPIGEAWWMIILVFFAIQKNGSITRVRTYQNAVYDSKNPKLYFFEENTFYEEQNQ